MCLVGEKFGGTSKTEVGDEFKKLENETDMRKELTEKLYESTNLYLKQLGKRKDSPCDKTKKMPLEILGQGMTAYGVLLPKESIYGK